MEKKKTGQQPIHIGTVFRHLTQKLLNGEGYYKEEICPEKVILEQVVVNTAKGDFNLEIFSGSSSFAYFINPQSGQVFPYHCFLQEGLDVVITRSNPLKEPVFSLTFVYRQL